MRQPQKRTPAALDNYIPPQDIEAEQATLGGMLIEAQAIDKVREILTETDFYRQGHRVLFNTLIAMSDRCEKVDLITVQSELRNRGQLEDIGGIPYLAILMDVVPTAVNVQYYADIVRFHSIRRQFLDAAWYLIGATMAAADNAEIDKALTEVMRRLEGGVRETSKSEQLGPVSMRLYTEAEERAEALKNGADNPRKGISVPFRQIQRDTGGLQAGQVITIAGRPSMGKTSLAIAFALQAGLQGKRVLFESLETSIELITQRCICAIAMLEPAQIRESHLLTGCEWERWAAASQTFYSMDFEIDAPPSLTPTGLATKCRQLERQGRKPDIIFLDYLQKMVPDRQGETRNLEIQAMLGSLNATAREMQAPLVLLSQLSREVEKRSSYRPMLSDLRESGAIEQDSYMVLFPYREAYYAEKAGQSVDPKAVQKVELIIAKHKDGPTGSTFVGWTPAYGRWEEWELAQRSLEAGGNYK